MNGTASKLLDISSGVPQGSILGTLFFLMYINVLPNCLRFCKARLYADDTNLTVSSSELPQIKELMSSDLKHVSTWLVVNKLSLNVLKSEFMIIGSKRRLATLDGNVDLSVDGYSLKRVQQTKCFGVHIDENSTHSYSR